MYAQLRCRILRSDWSGGGAVGRHADTRCLTHTIPCRSARGSRRPLPSSAPRPPGARPAKRPTRDVCVTTSTQTANTPTTRARRSPLPRPPQPCPSFRPTHHHYYHPTTTRTHLPQLLPHQLPLAAILYYHYVFITPPPGCRPLGAAPGCNLQKFGSKDVVWSYKSPASVVRSAVHLPRM